MTLAHKIHGPISVRTFAVHVARTLLWSSVCFVLVVTTAQPVAAQYFGRNKVQYDRLDFRILPTDHFRVHFYPAESLATLDAARMAERWYARHRSTLNFEFTKSPLIFYADHPDFQQSNVIGGTISQGTGGVTEGLRERVIMPFTGVYAETDHVLGHELVHVFQYKIAAASKAGLRSIGNIPLWLIEGMAEYLSLGRNDPNTAMWLRDAVRRNDLPTVDQLTRDGRYFPYRYGQALWAYIGGRWGDDAVARVYRAALAKGWSAGVQSELGVSLDSLSSQWHAAIRTGYGPTVSARTAPDQLGRAVAVSEDRGVQNVSPSVSPDGRMMAYFSSRGLFGVDLYVADVATGRVIRQLTSVTSGTHFDELSFISSAGTWSPDGTRFAFVVFDAGNQDIRIVNAQSGKEERRIRIDGVTAMSDPAWSPDGNRIALSGLKGGISDLYVYDLHTNQAQQLTNDREAQIQPAWSPDGSVLAFATDAGADTDFGTLRFGDMRLATINVHSHAVHLLPRLGARKHINPQFTPDGRALMFVSDVDGVSDIYRMALDGGAVRRITQVATGISGITGLSPAISVARNSGTLLFSVFNNQGFSIRALDAEQLTQMPAYAQSTVELGVLPPAPTAVSAVASYLDNPTTGLPAVMPTRTIPYNANVTLDFVGGASLGVTGGGGYGNGISGGVSLGFSDELGNRTIQGVVSAQGDFKDFGGQLLYLDRSRRINWGVQGSHVPQLGGYSSYGTTTVTSNGNDFDALVYTLQLQRQYYQSLQLIAQYPLSTTRRLEFSAGGERIAFGRQVDSVYSVGNQVVRESRTSLPSADALTFATATAALVGDYSFFGFTSPVAGGRYRFEVSPSFGTLSYTSATADYRRYLLLHQVTFAMRGLHYGRYGGDAASARIQPLYLGQPQLIRGYDANSFTPQECSGLGSTGECPEFARLTGTRLGVLNAELRIPLLGNRQFGLIPFSFLPVEVAPFVDAGVAWSAGDDVDFRFSRTAITRIPVVSTGVSVRANLFGYAVGEFYWAKPFQRPQKGSVFGFQLQPGW